MGVNLVRVDRAARANWSRRAAAAHGSFVGKLVRKDCRWAEVQVQVNDRVRNELEAGIETRRNHASGFVLVLVAPSTRGHISATTLPRTKTPGEHQCHRPTGRENHDLSLQTLLQIPRPIAGA